MKFFRGKKLLFILYAIVVTILFLYLLFPGQLLKNRLESAASSAGFTLKSSSLHASFPLGIKLKNVTISSSSPAEIFFQRAEELNVQLNLSSIFRSRTLINFDGKAYGGNFSGTAGIISFNQAYPPAEGNLSFKNIELKKLNFIGDKLGKTISGKAQGSVKFSTDKLGRITGGNVKIFLTGGTYPLTNPFLGLNKIDFENVDIQAEIKNGKINLQRFEVLGGQINCLLNGEIIPQKDLINGRLNLTGTMEVAGKNKIKMRIIISGTVANPVFNYT